MPLIASPNVNTGRYIEVTRKPTMLPTTMINTGAVNIKMTNHHHNR